MENREAILLLAAGQDLKKSELFFDIERRHCGHFLESSSVVLDELDRVLPVWDDDHGRLAANLVVLLLNLRILILASTLCETLLRVLVYLILIGLVLLLHLAPLRRHAVVHALLDRGALHRGALHRRPLHLRPTAKPLLII